MAIRKRGSGGAPVKVGLVIDVEPDPRMVDPAKPEAWEGFEQCFRFMNELRPKVQELMKEPVRFSWAARCDEQIRVVYGDRTWGLQRYQSEFSQLEASGDEIGVHCHLYRWDEALAVWVSDMEDPEWVRRCTLDALGAYRAHFGKSPLLFSFGDRFTSGDAIALLDAEGVLVEVTVEPGLGELTSYLASEEMRGRIPSYRDVSHAPWHPSHSDYLRADLETGRSILLVPVCTYRFPWWLEPTRRASLLRRRLGGEEITSDEYALGDVRLCLTHRPYVFRAGLRRVLRGQHSGQLHFVIRSSQFLEARCRANIESNMRWLAAAPFGQRFRFDLPTGWSRSVDEIPEAAQVSS